MTRNKENIILFPKWQAKLEKASLHALEEGRYDEALSKLNKLIDFKVNNHEILFGKLLCLMELERYEEAEDLCEILLGEENEDYYHYAHVYVTILFQTNQYDRVIDHLDDEFMRIDREMPELLREQFEQLYDMSKQMQQEVLNQKSTEFIKQFFEEIKTENYMNQWRLLENLRKMNVAPPEKVLKLLADDQIHPVIKTVIFKWLQDRKSNAAVLIHKFNQAKVVVPKDIATIHNHILMKEVLLLINEIEQSNPTLYILLKQVLYRYIYVKFPFVPKNEEASIIANALNSLGEKLLNIEHEETLPKQVKKFKEEIELCETLYLSVIEE